MRRTRLSSVVGWTAVALLAIAGFAAFGDPVATTQEIQVEAAAASIGHTSGAYAGLGFAILGDGGAESQVETPAAQGDYAAPEALDQDTGGGDEGAASPGTIVSPTSGWLSQVEVRALVSLYFEEEDVNRAIRVAWCESRFDPGAVDLNTGATGLFKHLPRYWEERAAKAGFPGVGPDDAEASVAAAAWAVYEGGGWDVFSCRG